MKVATDELRVKSEIKPIRIKTKKETKREHNHFPMGKTGYDPKAARLNDITTTTKKKKA
jgi:hypothetical protein